MVIGSIMKRCEHSCYRQNIGHGLVRRNNTDWRKTMRSRRFQFTSIILSIVLPACFLATVTENFAARQGNSSQDAMIAIDIANADALSKAKEVYQLGPEVRVKVIAENQTDQQIRVAVLNQYAQNRPQLFRDG